MGKVRVFEVGPRDGFQNESIEIPISTRLIFVEGLIRSGIKEFELGAFVRPDRVPQMADTEKLYAAIKSKKLNLKSATPYALVPNLRGLERAIGAGAKNICVFTASTEKFARRNIGMSIAESLAVIKDVIVEANRNKIKVRGYVSTAFGCPYEGEVKPSQALRVIRKLLDLGVTEVSVGDTIGIAGPRSAAKVMGPAIKNFGTNRIAGHFHDTRGMAVANVVKSLELGVRTFDSSAGGLGGCPYAPAATGNLATEDLVFMLNDLGMKTGIDLKKLSEASLQLAKNINRPLSSRYLQAFQAGSRSGFRAGVRAGSRSKMRAGVRAK